ncbi:ubiquinol oxidase subunit II [Novosphingobium sp. FKTRR1]|uniref:ubiquinol oxidase subunit II n=1 Tax=Novosphingobium sp. FKTRR1 TaxID=2879118 RepID=UPI001CF03A36|nr:ubiquinol oxidase subunit II [Novosphingobium sp. FKTRR1]
MSQKPARFALLASMHRFRPRLAVVRTGLVGSAAALLGGCKLEVLNPSGDVAWQQAHMVEIATALMLLIIVPVMALTVWFAWKYRAGNTEARYEPEWSHSTQLELVIWSAPLLIIIALGAVTWVGTHLQDPYRALARIDKDKPLDARIAPLDIEVVALDWKWLFIYPGQKVATVNELVLPVDRQVRFHITSATVMNSFYVPAMAGQIYAMPGMETTLHAVLNKQGDYTGFSANYSGAGFSHMRFATHGVSAAAFESWAAGLRDSKGAALTREAYLQLEKPSEKEPVRRFASVAPDLFDAVVNLCVRPGKMCASEMMALDARGGTGSAGRFNMAALTYDKNGREQVASAVPGGMTAADRLFVKAWCAPTKPLRAASAEVASPANSAPLRGAAIAWPGSVTKPAGPLLSLARTTRAPRS